MNLGSIREADAETQKLISEAMRILGSIHTPRKAEASRTNGRRPVRPGSRPRGRPRKH